MKHRNLILTHDSVWAIEMAYGQAALQALEGVGAEFLAGRMGGGSPKPFEMADGVAIIGIGGPLTKADTCANWMLGGTSTALIRQQVRAAAADPDVKSILLVIDSPGGQVSGTQDLADDVYAARQKKKVTAYIEDMGCSAAYWIASQADEVVCNATAVVGSIGCYGVVADSSERAKMLGIKVHAIASGPYKGAGVDGTIISEDQLAEKQKMVDGFASQFIDAIARGRDMDVEAVRALATGQVWIGADAVSNGLVDRVESIDATIRDLQSGAPASRFAATAGATPQEDTSMSEKAEKVGLFRSMLNALGLTAADIQDTQAAGGDPTAANDTPATPQHVASSLEPDKLFAEKLKKIESATAAAASTLANTEVKAFADELIRAGKLTTAERAEFEAAMLQCFKADGGGTLGLTETGALVEGDTVASFKKVASGRPAHKLFGDHLAGGKLDAEQESESSATYRDGFNARFNKDKVKASE